MFRYLRRNKRFIIPASAAPIVAVVVAGAFVAKPDEQPPSPSHSAPIDGGEANPAPRDTATVTKTARPTRTRRPAHTVWSTTVSTVTESATLTSDPTAHAHHSPAPTTTTAAPPTIEPSAPAERDASPTSTKREEPDNAQQDATAPTGQMGDQANATDNTE